MTAQSAAPFALPPDGSSSQTLHAARPRAVRAAAPSAPFNRIAFSAAHVVADPLADVDPWLAVRDRLGRDHRLPPHLWASASASPRRWTRRSAAWASTGRPRSS